MKREIKFRGKRIDNSGWVYGRLLTNKLGAYIVYEENPHECTEYGYIEINGYDKVDIETVSQFTGLKDKNGTEIWKNDICRVGSYVGVVKYLNGGYYIGDWAINFKLNQVEVIDNPELIHTNK